MELTVFLKMLLDAAVFHSVAGFALNLLFPEVSGITPALIFPALAAAAAFLLTERDKNRHLAMALLLPLCLFAHSTADWVLTAILCGYVFYIIHRQMFFNDDGDFKDAFQKQSFLCAVCCIISGVTVDLRMLNDVLLPNLLVIVVCAVALLRALRHTREVMDSDAFKRNNLLTIVVVCASTIVLSSDVFLGTIGTTLSFIYNKVVLQAFTVFIYAMARFLSLFSKLFAMIFNKEVVFREDGDKGAASGMEELLYDEVEGDVPEVLIWICCGLAAAGAALLLWKGLKALAGRNRRFEQNSPFALSRQAIEIPKEERRNPFARRNERESIRHQYRKFLRECLERGFLITPDYDSQEISRGARDYFRGAPLDAFRSLYIKARYTDREISREEAKEAKELYSQIKKSSQIEKEIKKS